MNNDINIGMIYLYLKTHNVTGLRYLGQTRQNPNVYKGSGIRWLNHLKQHGNDVTTEILFETVSYQDLGNEGKFYSKLWDVVNDSDFANLIEETGAENKPAKNRKISKSRMGSKWITNGTVDSVLFLDDSLPSGFRFGRAEKHKLPKSSETRQKMRDAALARPKKTKKRKAVYKYICSNCNIEFSRSQKRNTIEVYCSRLCRGKAFPKVSNPSGKNRYS